jgi:hypothetical protein
MGKSLAAYNTAIWLLSHTPAIMTYFVPFGFQTDLFPYWLELCFLTTYRAHSITVTRLQYRLTILAETQDDIPVCHGGRR